jgi:cell fate (sporulation/competence/biofilm development) regulator YlbF (YheA/YmcA/DUF963 family)
MEAHAGREVAVGKEVEMTTAYNTISDTMLEAISALEENLVQSGPFLRFQEEERKLHADREAMHLLSEFSELQQKIRTQHDSGAISEADFKRLRELQGAISDNDAIQEHDLAQEKAAASLREINQVISNLLGIDFASLTRRSSGCC